ncbi:MAG: hypothetical protein FWG20_04515 [Candidatus Cloacimonetes bacterium]|nr:hypothetical protein [Candidatus Cloacimonadota bacterium]
MSKIFSIFLYITVILVLLSCSNNTTKGNSYDYSYVTIRLTHNYYAPQVDIPFTVRFEGKNANSSMI